MLEWKSCAIMNMTLADHHIYEILFSRGSLTKPSTSPTGYGEAQGQRKSCSAFKSSRDRLTRPVNSIMKLSADTLTTQKLMDSFAQHDYVSNESEIVGIVTDDVVN